MVLLFGVMTLYCASTVTFICQNQKKIKKETVVQLAESGAFCKIYGHHYCNYDFDHRHCIYCGKEEPKEIRYGNNDNSNDSDSVFHDWNL